MLVWELQLLLQMILSLSWEKHWKFHLYQKHWTSSTCSWCSEYHSWSLVRVTLLLAHTQSHLCCSDSSVILLKRSCVTACLLSSELWEQYIIWSSCWTMLLFQNDIMSDLSSLNLSWKSFSDLSLESWLLCLLFWDNNTAWCCSSAHTEMRINKYYLKQIYIFFYNIFVKNCSSELKISERLKNLSLIDN